MGNETQNVQESEFVFRRLADALQLGGKDVNPYVWLAVLVPVLLLGLFYVGWMYIRDGRAIGWYWAAFLGCLRSAVYLILAAVFLLPAWQVWDATENRSKVVILMDVSGSMSSKDDLPTDTVPLEKIQSRQDKVIRFLTDADSTFLKKLQERNPVSFYRFGSVLDDDLKTFDGGTKWTPEEWSSWLKPDAKQEIPAELPEDEKTLRRKKLDMELLLVNGTNIADSLVGVLNRESNNMLQGIIVVSDGHSTQFSAQTFEEIRARAEKSKVPIFTVGVGETRQPVNIRIAGLLAPDQARPDDRFPVRVDVEGDGLAGKEVDVSLDVTKPSGEKVTLKPNLKPGEVPTFKPGEPPHTQVEFEIDKPEVEGEWKLVARIPRDKHEAFQGKEHISEPVPVNVVKKPVRILLFAGAPTHEYQFTRSLFVREMDHKRVELSIYLQQARPEVVQDVPPERMLHQFPSVFAAADDPKASAEDRYNNLFQYDLIIAFDPDWTSLSPEQMALLEKWVGTHAGGLILVAGTVNTYQLAVGLNYEKVRTILDLFPVLLEDSRLQGLGAGERPSTEPWRLNFPGATADMEFLKLDEESKDQLAGWEEFFTGQARGEGSKEAVLRRGFYNYYPVKGVKPNATVVATFTDPRARLSDGREQPFLVTMPYGSGKVVYLGSGEMRRLRQFREVFHERFWTKLARYAGSGNLTKISSHGRITMGKTFGANNYVPVEAQLFGRDMEPLSRNEKPKAQVTVPGSDKPMVVEMMGKAAGQGNEANGWFQGRFLVTTPGNYELRLPIPTTAEILTRKFTVKESNPEMDNTLPDFAQLRQIASEAGLVINRVPDDLKSVLKAELDRTNKTSGRESPEDSVRLYFDLKAAEMLPQCMITDRKTQRARGPVKDIWDRGVEVSEAEPPWTLSYVLLIVIGLLSAEWLTRKLLKLA